jgi:DNA-binding IscR family transcriptional regulator
MSYDSRLSGVLHILVHLTEYREAVPSEGLAKIMGTNPVVVRRILGGLRESGIVQSEKGHGGGWSLAREPGDITLLSIYTALGSPPIFALSHRSPSPDCLVEQAVNGALENTFTSAQALIFAQLEHTTLAALVLDVEQRKEAKFGSPPQAHSPASRRV